LIVRQPPANRSGGTTHVVGALGGGPPFVTTMPATDAPAAESTTRRSSWRNMKVPCERPISTTPRPPLSSGR